MKKPTIIDAAHQLGVCARKLYAALRRERIIGSMNIALPKYERAGDFINELRDFKKPGTNITRQYLVSTVTAKGMSLLQEIIDAEIRAGRELRSGYATNSRVARAG
ncbi:MAG: hypothetical protein JWM78_1633 [Verrucomicrobiaceae bacterium]|nr:hypothetical protein [Verrucomicrobiaceae bacterium]